MKKTTDLTNTALQEVQILQEFNFPAYSITVYASNILEAKVKLEEILKGGEK